MSVSSSSDRDQESFLFTQSADPIDVSNDCNLMNRYRSSSIDENYYLENDNYLNDSVKCEEHLSNHDSHSKSSYLSDFPCSPPKRLVPLLNLNSVTRHDININVSPRQNLTLSMKSANGFSSPVLVRRKYLPETPSVCSNIAKNRSDVHDVILLSVRRQSQNFPREDFELGTPSLDVSIHTGRRYTSTHEINSPLDRLLSEELPQSIREPSADSLSSKSNSSFLNSLFEESTHEIHVGNNIKCLKESNEYIGGHLKESVIVPMHPLEMAKCFFQNKKEKITQFIYDVPLPLILWVCKFIIAHKAEIVCLTSCLLTILVVYTSIVPELKKVQDQSNVILHAFENLLELNTASLEGGSLSSQINSNRYKAVLLLTEAIHATKSQCLFSSSEHIVGNTYIEPNTLASIPRVVFDGISSPLATSLMAIKSFIRESLPRGDVPIVFLGRIFTSVLSVVAWIILAISEHLIFPIMIAVVNRLLSFFTGIAILAAALGILYIYVHYQHSDVEELKSNKKNEIHVESDPTTTVSVSTKKESEIFYPTSSLFKMSNWRRSIALFLLDNDSSGIARSSFPQDKQLVSDST